MVVLDTAQLKLAVATAQAAPGQREDQLPGRAGQRQLGQSPADAAVAVRPVRAGQRPEELRFPEGARRYRGSPGLRPGYRQEPAPAGPGEPAGCADSAGAEQEIRHLDAPAASPGHRPGQLQLQTAELNLQYASIKAPYAGQIAAVNVNPGTYVSQNTAVFIIVSLEKEIIFNVPPADAPNLPVGTTVQFTYLGRSYPVKVSQAPSAPINGVIPMVTDVPRSFPLPYGAVGTVSYSAHDCAGRHRADCRASDERGPELRLCRREREGDHAEYHHPRPVRDKRGGRRRGGRGPGDHECSARGCSRRSAVQVMSEPDGRRARRERPEDRASPPPRRHPAPRRCRGRIRRRHARQQK